MGLDVRVAVPCGIEIEGRRDDAAQVVFTVLDNARKHAAMSAVELRVAVSGAATTLYIEDDGIGITSALGERLFERGVRGDGSAGRGLGLFIARRLMVDQGGSLDAHAPTRRRHVVRARLPQRTVELAPADSLDSPSGHRGRMTGRMLVVEDHALVAIGLQLALSARGWEVETTDGPTAADIIRHAQRFQPQCVLLDIRLGEVVGSGIDLIRPLLATGAKVVMLTAETQRNVLASSVEAGAAGWVGKDIFLDDMEATLRDVLAGTALIGRADRDAMIDELRLERASRVRALSPFEQLTQREREVLAALAEGLSAEEIADTQFVALATVRSQIRSVLKKLGVRSQLAAVAQAHRVGWSPRASRLSVA